MAKIKTPGDLPSSGISRSATTPPRHSLSADDADGFIEDQVQPSLSDLPEEVRRNLRETASGWRTPPQLPTHPAVGDVMTQDWNRRLQAAFKEKGRERNRPVRLPSPLIMAVTGEGDHATVELTDRAVVGNMQENASAFEGWCLALHFWCGVSVSLRWKAPVDRVTEPTGKQKVEARHYQRFLYRVERFKSLFPDWFDIAPVDPNALREALIAKSPILNIAGDRTRKAASGSETASKTSPEYDLESRLLIDQDFDRFFGFGPSAQKDRQFPVGLFSSQVLRDNAIFPGGKGAIDLVCLDGKHLWLFELKAGGNIPIGTVTELIFYTSVLRDAQMGHFRFADGLSGHTVKTDHVAALEAVTAVMLGDDLHPLLSDAGILMLLNEAAELRWNNAAKAPHVSFRAAQITNTQRPVPAHIPLLFEARGG